MPQLSSPRTLSNHAYVEILNRIRLIAINGQIALILFATWYLKINLPLNWLVLIIGLEISLQIYSYLRVKNSSPISSFALLWHLVADSLILAALVYFTGGANNPFIYLLLLQIALGTMMLKPGDLILVCVLQLGLYSLLNLYQRPLELGESSPLNSYHLHLAGMWVNFILTVVLIAIFGLLARNNMLQQEKKIQRLNEKQLKDEQLLSLGIMSASAAHELGTPLSTMAVVIDDLKHSELDQVFQEDLEILSNQIDASRQIIQSLSQKSQATKKRLNEEQSDDRQFKELLTQTFDHWLVYRPQMIMEQKWDESLTSIKHPLPISVEQAITNLLDNAADAGLENGSDKIQVNCFIEQNNILINILDDGKGITEEVQNSIGASLAKTEKKEGLGWGLFLSNAGIERVGGKVQLANRAEGGTATTISLPLYAVEEMA